MKCLNCSYEFADNMNFCPNCGTKAGETKNEEQVIQIVKVKKDNKELLSAVCQMAIFFGIGMTLVCIFFAFNGFGMFERKVNMLTVWITLAASIIIGVSGALYYFLVLNKPKKK